MAWLLTAFTAMIAVIVGAAMLASSGWAVYRAIRLTFYWPKTSAQIVRYWITRSQDSPEGQRFFHPVIKFETADGRSIVAISPWGSWRRPWPIGRMVSVHYNPRNPRSAEVDCFANIWGMPLTFVALTAMLGAAIAFFGLR